MAVVRINVQIAQLLKFVVFTCYSRGLNTRLCIYIPKTITVVEWTFDSSNWTCYCSSSVQLLSRVRLCDPMSCSTPGLLVHHQLPEFTQTHVHRAVMPSLILCRPFLLLPPIPPSIRIFSNESTLPIRWRKYWSFSFSISPSKEHPGLPDLL